MMTGYIITISISIGIIAILLIFKSRLRTAAVNISASKIKAKKRVEADNFVKQLEELGYFKYASEEDARILKEDIASNFNPFGGFSTTFWYDSDVSKDCRCYPCDGENVYELGGITQLLNDLKPTFDKLDFECEISGHIEDWDLENDWLNHRIILNETEYTIFKNFSGIGWGEAPKRIAEILNTELEKQGIDEKIYLISGGNEGELIILTDELYKYIRSAYKNPYWIPLETEEWAEIMGVEPMNLS